MTDLPLPEPARVEWVPDDILPGSILTAYYTADQMLREREAYAAAKTAELQAKVTRYEESTRLAEAHITLTLAQLAEAQAECASEKANNDAMVDCCDALDKKLRNAEAECARLRAAAESCANLREAIEGLRAESRHLPMLSHKGAGIDYCVMKLDAALRGKE